MARQKRTRTIGYVPTHRSVEGATCKQDLLVITLEELEAMRLADVLGLDQSESAKRMGISRGTFQRIIAEARKKSAKSLLLGMTMVIEDGNSIQKESLDHQKGSILVAIPMYGLEVSDHFGKAKHFQLFFIEDGVIIRNKLVGNNWMESDEDKDFVLIQEGVTHVLTKAIGPYAEGILRLHDVVVSRGNYSDPNTWMKDFLK